MRKLSKGLIIAITLNSLLVAGVAYAAPDIPSSAYKDFAGQDMMRIREGLEQYRVEKQISEDKERVSSKVEPKVNDIKEPEVAATFHLQKITTDSSKVLTEAELGSVLDKYSNTEISVKGIFKAIKELNNLYAEKGYANCRAILEKQVIKDGIVKLTLLEAVTSDAKVINNRYTKPSYITKRLHLPQGEIANINTLNEDLLHFNATNDVQLRVIMQPGSEPGSTEYDIQAYEPQQFNTTVFTDNAGSYNSGIYRLGTFFNVKSLTGERDALSLGVMHSKGADAFTTIYNRQVGRSGTKLNLAYNTNSIDVNKGEGRGLIDGHSYAYTVSINQPWIINSKIRSEVALEYNHQKSTTTFMKSTNLVDDTLDDVTASFSLINYGKSHWFYQKHGLVRGYHNNDRDYLGNESDNFGYYKFNGMYQKAYKHGQAVNARLDGQWSGGSQLPSARQFYIGGMSSVRGYKESLISGDSGYSVNLEYLVPLKDKKTSAFVFCDYGNIHGEHAFEDHVLQSVGFGFKSNPTKHIGAQFSFGFPLIKKVNTEDISKMRVHFMVSGQF